MLVPTKRRTRFCALALAASLSACGGGGDDAAADRGASALGAASIAGDAPRPLKTPVAALAASLVCGPGLDAATRSPVLLVHGTALDARNNYSWNWVPALRRERIPYCTVDLPARGMGDIQLAAEHVVYALREMARRTGRKVQIVGYSQGGMLPRWALRFWPDTRALVDDLVSLSASNHGSESARFICLAPCAPSFWQQHSGSAFIAALNRDFETLPGISYTSIYTRLDEVVVPNVGPNASSALRGGGPEVLNVATQEVCPLNTADHLLIGTADPVAYAIALDALRHPGPAQPARVSRAACRALLMPGVNPLTFAIDFAASTATIAQQVLLAPRVAQEPALECYVDGRC